MAHAIGCTVSQDDLFNELGCSGGATLFIDNIDQIDDAGDWATVTDLLTAVVELPVGARFVPVESATTTGRPSCRRT